MRSFELELWTGPGASKKRKLHQKKLATVLHVRLNVLVQEIASIKYFSK